MNLMIRPARWSDIDVICEFNRRLARETENKDLDPVILRAGVGAMFGDPRKGSYFVAETDPHPQPLSQGERGDAEVVAPHPQPLFQGERGDPRPLPLSQGERGDGEVVGQLGVTCEWSDWRNGNFWWIQSVYVAASARRHGVFRKLFAHLLQEARAQTNVIGVRLYVEQDNHVAQATYEKLGMSMTGYQVMEMILKRMKDEG
jgi:GNAT superfamily N-acetyltransferase